MKPKDTYDILFSNFGPQKWWPAKTPFEVVVGALLTQQTSWYNVEKAIKKLREKKLLSPKKLLHIETKELSTHLKPTGYYRQKAQRLKILASEFPRLNKLRNKPIDKQRKELLKLNGVGKETADSILLYAFNRPILPIDAYTHRTTERIYGVDGNYEEIRLFHESSISKNPKTLNEYHALIVELAKRYCKKGKPNCVECPITNCKHRKNSKLK